MMMVDDDDKRQNMEKTFNDKLYKSRKGWISIPKYKTHGTLRDTKIMGLTYLTHYTYYVIFDSR